jgi:hypothetical protein
VSVLRVREARQQHPQMRGALAYRLQLVLGHPVAKLQNLGTLRRGGATPRAGWLQPPRPAPACLQRLQLDVQPAAVARGVGRRAAARAAPACQLHLGQR